MAEQEVMAEDHRLEWTDAARIVFVALACAAVWFRIWEPFDRVSLIGLVAALIGMYPILKEAFEAVLSRRMTMELSMTIAIGAALAIGQFFTGLVIILFVLIAEVLEGMTVGRGRPGSAATPPSARSSTLSKLPRSLAPPSRKRRTGSPATLSTSRLPAQR